MPPRNGGPLPRPSRRRAQHTAAATFAEIGTMEVVVCIMAASSLAVSAALGPVGTAGHIVSFGRRHLFQMQHDSLPAAAQKRNAGGAHLQHTPRGLKYYDRSNDVSWESDSKETLKSSNSDTLKSSKRSKGSSSKYSKSSKTSKSSKGSSSKSSKSSKTSKSSKGSSSSSKGDSSSDDKNRSGKGRTKDSNNGRKSEGDGKQKSNTGDNGKQDGDDDKKNSDTSKEDEDKKNSGTGGGTGNKKRSTGAGAKDSDDKKKTDKDDDGEKDSDDKKLAGDSNKDKDTNKGKSGVDTGDKKKVAGSGGEGGGSGDKNKTNDPDDNSDKNKGEAGSDEEKDETKKPDDDKTDKNKGDAESDKDKDDTGEFKDVVSENEAEVDADGIGTGESFDSEAENDGETGESFDGNVDDELFLTCDDFSSKSDYGLLEIRYSYIFHEDADQLQEFEDDMLRHVAEDILSSCTNVIERKLVLSLRRRLEESSNGVYGLDSSSPDTIVGNCDSPASTNCHLVDGVMTAYVSVDASRSNVGCEIAEAIRSYMDSKEDIATFNESGHCPAGNAVKSVESNAIAAGGASTAAMVAGAVGALVFAVLALLPCKQFTKRSKSSTEEENEASDTDKLSGDLSIGTHSIEGSTNTQEESMPKDKPSRAARGLEPICENIPYSLCCGNECIAEMKEAVTACCGDPSITEDKPTENATTLGDLAEVGGGVGAASVGSDTGAVAATGESVDADDEPVDANP